MIASQMDDTEEITLESVFTLCLEKQLPASSFREVIDQFNYAMVQSITMKEFVNVCHGYKYQFQHSIVGSYILEVLTNCRNPKLAEKLNITLFLPYLSLFEETVQTSFFLHLTKDESRLSSLVDHFQKISLLKDYSSVLNPFHEDEIDMDSELHEIYLFLNNIIRYLNNYISNVNSNEAIVGYFIYFFCGFLRKIINSNIEHYKNRENLLVIPQFFFDYLIKNFSSHLKMITLQENISNYFDVLEQIKISENNLSKKKNISTEYNNFHTFTNISKTFQLVWLSIIMDNANFINFNDAYFLNSYTKILNRKLAIFRESEIDKMTKFSFLRDRRSMTRVTAVELKLLVSSLIGDVLECFCIAIIDEFPVIILQKWKLFFEKQLPMLILKLKQSEGQSLSFQNIDTRKTNFNEDGDFHFNVGFDVDHRLSEIIQLSKFAKNSEVVSAIQDAIVDIFDNLDKGTYTILKLFAKEQLKNESKSDFLFKSSGGGQLQQLHQNQLQNVYCKALTDLSKTNSIDTNIQLIQLIDARHEFLKSCLAFRLIDLEHYHLCLKDDSNLSKSPLRLDDDVIVSSKIVYDLKRFLSDNFINKNIEFETINNSTIFSCLSEMVDMFATGQYQMSLCILAVMTELFSQKKNFHLRRISLSLLLNLNSLDLIMTYISPIDFLTPIISYLDNEFKLNENDNDVNFQDTFTDFGCLFLLVIFIVKQYNIKAENLGIPEDSFCMDFFFNFGNIFKDRNIDESVLKSWADELFHSSSGISDELISKLSAKESLYIVTYVFGQAYLALEKGIIDFETFKNGVEYFFQPFLLMPLVVIFTWTQDFTWNISPITNETEKNRLHLLMKVIDYLLVPEVNEEAKVIHSLILLFVSPASYGAIISVIRESKMKLNIDTKPIGILLKSAMKNDYKFNLQQISSNKFFTEERYIYHFLSKQYKKSQFDILDLQINSLVVWNCESCFSSIDTKIGINSFTIPQYYPYLLNAMTTQLGDCSGIIEHMINKIVDFSNVLAKLSQESSKSPSVIKLLLKSDKLWAKILKFTNPTRSNVLASSTLGNPVSNGSLSMNNSSFNSAKNLSNNLSSGAISVTSGQKVMTILSDVLSFLIISNSVADYPKRVDVWMQFLKVNRPEYKDNQSDELNSASAIEGLPIDNYFEAIVKYKFMENSDEQKAYNLLLKHLKKTILLFKKE